MDRRAFLGRLTAVTIAGGVAGCAGSSSEAGNETLATTRTATGDGTPTGTAKGEPTTTTGPPDIPPPGTPPVLTETAEATTTTGPPDIPPPGTPPVPTRTTNSTVTEDGPPDIPPPGTPPVPGGTIHASCSLSHRIVASGDDRTPNGGSVLRYADLSPAAKRVVGRAVASNETVSIPYNSPNRPPEFAYSEKTHSYDIEYRGTTYRLFTATGTSCPVVTATG